MRAGNVQYGRMILAGAFVLFRVHELWIYFSTPEGGRKQILGLALPIGLLTTALMVCLWYRKPWARALLIAIFLIRVGAAMVFIPTLIDAMLADPGFLFRVLSAPILDALFAWALIASPDIRRLGSRYFE